MLRNFLTDHGKGATFPLPVDFPPDIVDGESGGELAPFVVGRVEAEVPDEEEYDCCGPVDEFAVVPVDGRPEENEVLITGGIDLSEDVDGVGADDGEEEEESFLFLFLVQNDISFFLRLNDKEKKD